MEELKPNVLRNVSEVNLSERETRKRQTVRDNNVITLWMGAGCLYFISTVGAAIYLPAVVPAEYQGITSCLTRLAVSAPFIAPFLSVDN